MATNPRGRSVLLHRPTVTLLTDFGTRDAYVASMKAVLIRECPEARLIDITQQDERQELRALRMMNLPEREGELIADGDLRIIR